MHIFAERAIVPGAIIVDGKGFSHMDAYWIISVTIIIFRIGTFFHMILFFFPSTFCLLRSGWLAFGSFIKLKNPIYHMEDSSCNYWNCLLLNFKRI